MLEKNGRSSSKYNLQIDEIAFLLRHCGKHDFPSLLMALLAKHLNVDHLSIFIFDHTFVPHLVVSESASGSRLAKTAGAIYQSSHFYRHDPNATRITREHSENSGPMLERLKAQDISDPDYRRDIYESFALLDRVSLIDHHNDRWVIANLYRECASGEFSKDDISVIEEISNLLSGLLEKHFLLIPPAAWQNATHPSKDMLESLINGLTARLSRREVEVCARALQGMTSKGIGLDLGIHTATVSTLRKRAYAKLNISGLHELFALCLNKTIELSSTRDKD